MHTVGIHRQINNKRYRAKESSVFHKHDAEAPLVALFAGAEHSWRFNVQVAFCGDWCHLLWTHSSSPAEKDLPVLPFPQHHPLLLNSNQMWIHNRAVSRWKRWAFVRAPSLPHLKSGPLFLGGHTSVFATSVWLIMQCTEMMNDLALRLWWNRHSFCLKYLRREVSSLHHPVWIPCLFSTAAWSPEPAAVWRWWKKDGRKDV